MSYGTAERRGELLAALAEIIDDLGASIAALGDAYEQLDEQSADRLEEQLFRPVQAAYGKAKRTYSEFAARSGLETRSFTPSLPMLPSTGVKGFIEAAVDSVERAEDGLTELQDSLAPVEVGDPPLRAGLADVRSQIAEIFTRAEKFVSTFGR